VYQIEISKTYGKTEWGEDIKKVLKIAGEANKQVVFLFADTQVGYTFLFVCIVVRVLCFIILFMPASRLLPTCMMSAIVILFPPVHLSACRFTEHSVTQCRSRKSLLWRTSATC
jgi:hypothetical protein